MLCHEEESNDTEVVNHRHHHIDCRVSILIVDVCSMLCLLQLKGLRNKALLQETERKQRPPNIVRTLDPHRSGNRDRSQA